MKWLGYKTSIYNYAQFWKALRIPNPKLARIAGNMLNDVDACGKCDGRSFVWRVHVRCLHSRVGSSTYPDGDRPLPVPPPRPHTVTVGDVDPAIADRDMSRRSSSIWMLLSRTSDSLGSSRELVRRTVTALEWRRTSAGDAIVKRVAWDVGLYRARSSPPPRWWLFLNNMHACHQVGHFRAQ